METVTLFSVQTTSLAISNFKKRKPGSLPMLNDNLGDRCHQKLEDAVPAAMNIGESLEEATITVVHVTYSRELHDELVRTQQIISLGTDFFGKPLWVLSPQACTRLNAQATFLMDPYPLPLIVAKPRAK